MKVLLLANANSIHTQRWIKSLRESKVTLGLFSLYSPDAAFYKDFPDIFISSLDLADKQRTKKENNFLKLVYLRGIIKVRQAIREFKPDILHAHYASSYGLLGALSGFHPYVLSVWGADIYDFPNFSFIHRAIIKYNLFKADRILSTSEIMKEETKKYTNKQIEVTPFGIDTDRFYPQKIESLFSDRDIVIGTVKSLEKKYGIVYLIKAFDLVKKNNPNYAVKLLIVGKGTLERQLKEIAQDLDLEMDIIFTGFIDHNKVEKYHNMLDISVSYSIDDSESFGVAVLEASACGKPVVVSNVGGLPEVVEDGITGFVVEPKNITVLAEVLNKLILNPELRIEMGKKGRERVIKKYNWSDSVKQMISIYNSLIN